MLYWHLSITKANKYKRKKETIQEWMNEDRVKQETYDNALEPQHIKCSNCNGVMKVRPTKELEDFMDTPMRVMFLFRCTKCQKKAWIYESGEIRASKPFLCPKCNKEAEMTHTRKGKKIIWTTSCSSCGFKEKSLDDFEEMDKQRDKREKEEKELLEIF